MLAKVLLFVVIFFLCTFEQPRGVQGFVVRHAWYKSLTCRKVSGSRFIINQVEAVGYFFNYGLSKKIKGFENISNLVSKIV